MNESEFLKRWREEEPIYLAWGRFVGSSLSEAVAGLITPTRLEMFLRLPVVPRIKEEDSLIQKAFYRGKQYPDPYGDIEDKVGLRFVVLLSDDIRVVEAAVQEGSDWHASKARDFEDERDTKPYEFDYQSVHYVVRARMPITFSGVHIPADIACEIQIRTLLQHAYSELTHDTIYKPSVRATPALKRAAAKSMALIEATGDYFTSVHKTITVALAENKRVSDFVTAFYERCVGSPSTETPLNSLIIDRYASMLSPSDEVDFTKCYEKKPFLITTIAARAKLNSLYRVPAILLVYYSVYKAPNTASVDSPLTNKELSPIYSDLGRTIPN